MKLPDHVVFWAGLRALHWTLWVALMMFNAEVTVLFAKNIALAVYPSLILFYVLLGFFTILNAIGFYWLVFKAPRSRDEYERLAAHRN